jgi:hypothetical protein
LLISFEIRIDQKFKIGANVNKMQSRLNLWYVQNKSWYSMWLYELTYITNKK